MNRPSVMWSVSLLTISITTLIIMFSDMLGFEFSNIFKTLFVVIYTVALPILIYTTLKYFKALKDQKNV